MFEVLNIKFDRSQSKPGEVVTSIGDAHLAKLEEVIFLFLSLILTLFKGCKVLLEKLRDEKQQRYLYFSELNSTEHEPFSTTEPPPVSGDYTEVALIYTEVLQLQVRGGQSSASSVLPDLLVTRIVQEMLFKFYQKLSKFSILISFMPNIIVNSHRATCRSARTTLYIPLQLQPNP
jgi:hypothetical protein